MKKLWIALLACSFAFPATSEPLHLLKEGYYLGSADVGQESGTLLAEASREGFSSILVWKQESKVRATWSLPDLRVNALGWLSEENRTFFVAGSTGHHPIIRSYLIKGRTLENLWDSAGLPENLANAEIQLSSDGRLWSAVSYGRTSATVAVGPTTDYEATKTWSLDFGEGLFGDPLHSTSLILNSDPEAPTLALLWHGVLQVLGDQKAARYLEISEEMDVSGLYFQERAKILWGIASYGRLVGFDLEQLFAEGPTNVAGKASFEIDSKRLGVKGFTNLTEHPSGDLLMKAQIGQRKQALIRLNPRIDTDRILEVTPMAKGSRLAGWGVLSPSGERRVEWTVSELPLDIKAP